MKVALLPWGDVIEDYLDAIGLSLEDFRTQMTGGWMFGYVEALKTAGVETVLVCVSREVRRPVRTRHTSGAVMWLLPATRSYRLLRARLRDPYAWKARHAIRGRRRPAQAVGLVARHLAPYTATPLRALAGALRAERCDALLCQEYEYARFDVSVAAGLVLRVPVFATFQGGDYQLSRLERPLRPLALRAAGGLIIGPEREAQRVRAKYGTPAAKMARVFNPMDLAAWGPAAQEDARAASRAELGLGADELVVAWHGRVELLRKGLDVLVDAWSRLCESHDGTSLRLLIVGTGPDAGELRRRIALWELRGVSWVDEFVLDRDRIRGYLAAADVYAFPSRHEGFPVAPIEAMASGLPVVAADAPGVREILGGGERGGGLIVPRVDAAALAGALRRVIDDAAWRKELGLRARRRVETAFAPEAVGRQLRDFLSQGP